MKHGKASTITESNANAPDPSGGLVVRTVASKTILNRSHLSDYSLNCYTGCAHGCLYCYARFMQRFHPHPEPWGQFVDVKGNAVEALERQLRRAKPGHVFVSSACDGWQPIESQRRLTRECCRRLAERGFELDILTKSALVLRDFDVLAGRRTRIAVTITTLDDEMQRRWEPHAASVGERFHVIDEAKRAGFKTAIMFGPLLPFLSDGPATIEALFARAAERAVDQVWVDALNPRPRVWPSVATLLGERFPALVDRYARVLFDPQARHAYLAQLAERVDRAAHKTGLHDRLSVCF